MGLRAIWFPGVHLWLLPLRGTLLSLHRVQQAVLPQSEAQAPHHHGRARPRGAWGSPSKPLAYRGSERHAAVYYGCTLCQALCYAAVYSHILLYLWENLKMEELLLSPFHT